MDYEGRVKVQRALATSAVVAVVVTTARPAIAQLHWDAALSGGATKRFLVERPAGAGDAGIGPTAQLTGHVALVPLLHLGAYFGHDISPLPGDAAARGLTWGGARFKVTIPWVRGKLRAWAFAGGGYVGTYARSYRTALLVPTGVDPVRREALVQGSGGGHVEVPFGFGVAYRLYKPWDVCAELGARVGFAHTGSTYEDPGPQVTFEGIPAQNVQPSGLDRLAVGLTVGVMIDL